MEGSVKDNMKDWSIWCAKVVELAKIESASRPFIKKLLESMQAGLDLPKPEGKHKCRYTLIAYFKLMLHVCRGT